MSKKYGIYCIYQLDFEHDDMKCERSDRHETSDDTNTKQENGGCTLI